MTYTIAHQRVAEFLDEALGDLLEDVAFADLVDDVVETLGTLADRVLDERVAARV